MLPATCPVCKKDALKYFEDSVVCISCSIYQRNLNIFQKALYWASSKTAWWRVLIVLYFVWFLVTIIKDPAFAGSRNAHFFGFFDLGMHEIGHQLFRPLGEFMTIAGGSLFQCIVPLLWLLGCLQRKWYFASTMCWCWLGINLFDVSVYAADARARELPLAGGLGSIGLGDDDAVYDMGHDWYQMLLRTNRLNEDLDIARKLRIAGVVCFMIGFIFAGLLLVRMFKGRLKQPAAEPTTESGKGNSIYPVI